MTMVSGLADVQWVYRAMRGRVALFMLVELHARLFDGYEIGQVFLFASVAVEK